jgi:hypoxanthine-guanine phosphoribosyltransferase
MKSIQNYIQSAQNQQLKFDSYTEKFDRWGDEINISYFGFTINNDIWYWFK